MREDNVDISVVLAVYNGEKYLKEAIDSILSQTFRTFEFIIINDGSIDSTKEIILSYSDSRITYSENKTNKGLVYSLNQGLSLSKGKYIARMDADDIALPQRLQEQFDYMESNPETGICGSDVEAFYQDSKKRKVLKFPSKDIDIRSFAFFQTPFCHPTVFMRKAILDENNLTYPDCYRAEDYALWVELLKYTQGVNLSSVLVRYRKHEWSETALADKESEDKNRIFGDIQEQYFFQNQISLDRKEMLAFTLFANRSIKYDLSLQSQRTISKILKNFFFQISQKQKHLQHSLQDYFSTDCFYRFLLEHRFPLTGYLQKLYFAGAFIYLKRILLNKLNS